MGFKVRSTVCGSILLGLSVTGCMSPRDDKIATPGISETENTSSPETTNSAVESPSVKGPNSLIALDVEKRANDERLSAGLGELIWDENLRTAAAQWAERMASEGYEHSPMDRLDGLRTGNGFGALAENIHNPTNQCPSQPCLFEDYYPSSGTLHVDWMRSTDHRNAILEPGFSRIGVGVYCSANGDLWAVTLFASDYQTRIPLLTQTTYKEPVMGTSDGYTCANRYKEHNPLWVNSPIK